MTPKQILERALARSEEEERRVNTFLEEHAVMFYEHAGIPWSITRDDFKLAVRALLKKHNLIFW